MKVQKALLIGAVAAALGLTAACSGENGGGSQSFKPEVTTKTPTGTGSVDSITWNLPAGEPPTLDPAFAALESVSTVEANLCEPLMRWNENYELEPSLATSVEHPDDTTWIFHIREGVKFWDGSPMTVDDVVYSLNRILDPELGSSWIVWAPDGAEVVATDDSTVTVTIPKFNSVIEPYFATPAFTVTSKKFTEQADSSFGSSDGGVMCTGPYKLDSWNAGQDLTITRNDSWWDTEVAPKVKSLKFSFVTDPAAQSAGLIDGEIEGQIALQISALSSLDRAEGNLSFGESLSPTFLAVANLDGPLGDLKVRQALAKSIDYEGIVESVYNDAAITLKALVPPAAWGYAEDVYQKAYDELPEPTQDLDEAKKLAESSDKGSEPITLAYFTANGEETKMATAIADSANSAGLKVELKPLDAGAYTPLFSSAEARKGIDAFIVTGYLDFPDPVTYYSYFATGAYYNFSSWDNQEYTDAVLAAQAESDPDAKAAEVAKAQKIMAEQLINIPVVSQYVSTYYSKDLGGLIARQNYLYTPWATRLGGA